MSRDDNNFGGNPGRMNSGGFNSTRAGGYGGPSDRSGTNTAGYAMARGFAPPGAGMAGRQYNSGLMGAIGASMGNGYSPSMRAPIRSSPIPPAQPNPANVQPTGVSNPIPGPSTPSPGTYQGTMDQYNNWWNDFFGDFTQKYTGTRVPGTAGQQPRPAAFNMQNGNWNPVWNGGGQFVTSNTGEWNPVSRGPNGPRNRSSIF